MRRKMEQEAPDPIGQLIVRKDMNIIQIDQIPDFINEVRLRNIEDTKRIKKIEALARGSFEYDRYMRYLKTNLNMNKCSYFSEISNTTTSLKIEIHHSPFTLFDITCAVANKHIIDHGFADEFDVADEVMKLHYMNLVGLIPVSPTVHELIHTESMDVHPGLTYGFWKIFIQQYRPYFTDPMLIKCKELEAWDRVQDVKVPQILSTKYTMLNYIGIPLYGDPTITNTQKLIEEMESINVG